MIKRALPLLLALLGLPCHAAVILVGDELAVKDGRPNNEHNPRVAFAADGSGLIVWTDSRDGVRGRFLTPDGTLAPEDMLLVAAQHLAVVPGEGTEIYRKDPAVLMAADGSFWLFWTEEVQHVVLGFFDERRDILDRDVRGQHFDAAARPLGPSRRFNNAPNGLQSRPQVLALACDASVCASPRFVLAWESDDLAPLSGPGEGILGQTFDLAGIALSSQVRLSPPSPAQHVTLAPGPAGGFVAAWEAPDATAPRVVLRARFFDGGLQPLDKAFLVSPKTPGIQRHASLVWNDATAEVTVIFDRTMPSTGRFRIVSQKIVAPGKVLGEPSSVSNGVAEAPAAGVLTPAKTVLALWVIWKGPYPYYLQGSELDSKTARPGRELRIAKWPRFDVSIVSAPNGRMLAVWEGWVLSLRQGIVARWLEQAP